MSRSHWIIVLILSSLVMALVLQNAGIVSLDIFFWHVRMSKAIFFPVLFLSGVCVGWVTGWVFRK